MTAEPRPKLLAAALPFGRLLRQLRIRAGLSQNQLARSAGIDPAYVNRLERAPDDSQAMPRRQVILNLYGALHDAAEQHRVWMGPEECDRLLASAGLLPESIVTAGGWDIFIHRIRAEVREGLATVLARVDALLDGVDPDL